MFTQKFIKIFHKVQEIELFWLFQNLALGKASTNDKCHFAISWTRCRQYQCVCKILSNIPNSLELSTFYTNRPVTKSSQTVRWQNQMFDYRALYESQPSVSVDFLRVVQLTILCWINVISTMVNSDLNSIRSMVNSDLNSIRTLANSDLIFIWTLAN